MQQSHCCNHTDEAERLKKKTCPNCGSSCLSVPAATVAKHIKKPWLQKPQFFQQSWYFCRHRRCETIYFSHHNRQISQIELRTPIAIKATDKSPDALLCFCYGIKIQDFQSKPQLLRQFIIEQTQSGNCACEHFNPSGQCCLKELDTSWATGSIPV